MNKNVSNPPSFEMLTILEQLLFYTEQYNGLTHMHMWWRTVANLKHYEHMLKP